ncbi:MAG: dockerin type I repeat-containing protein, partial [Porcipelethomonas sp.]
YYAIIDGLDIPATEPSTEPATEPPTDAPTDPEIDFIPGDVKADGVVDVFDAVALRDWLIRMSQVDMGLQYPEASARDTNGDGYVQINDLVLLHEYLVGKDVELKYYTGE